MIFTPLYFADRLHIVNPHGDVGVVTLWSPVKTVLDFLARQGISLDPASARIAALGTLYGDGLPHLIRNLLWNPQIRHILILGQNLSGSAEGLANLLTRGVEPAERLGQPRFRIRGTERFLDTAFDPGALTGQTPVMLGKLSDPVTVQGVHDFFAALPPPDRVERERVWAPLPEYQPVYFPSDPRAHTITERRPLEAWKAVVARVLRFGVPSVAGEGKRRLELQNLKVIVTEPMADTAESVQAAGVSMASLEDYQKKILSYGTKAEMHYTYEHRLRTHWDLDTLAAVGEKLAADAGSRGAFVSLWETGQDLTTDKATPCLVSLFFRVFQGTLTLSATFRVHNVMSAWLKNVYGLMAIQQDVARGAGGVPCGPLTVLSHSIAIDPDAPERLDLARQMVASRPMARLREDPNGYFTFTLDRERGEILAVHKAAGETLTEYRGRSAVEIERRIVHDGAISDIGHALYVGRQLAILEERLKKKQS